MRWKEPSAANKNERGNRQEQSFQRPSRPSISQCWRGAIFFYGYNGAMVNELQEHTPLGIADVDRKFRMEGVNGIKKLS